MSGDELARVLIDRFLLLVDRDQIGHRDRVRMRNNLQVTATVALAPTRGGHFPPLGIRRRWRQQCFDARKHPFRASEPPEITSK